MNKKIISLVICFVILISCLNITSTLATAFSTEIPDALMIETMNFGIGGTFDGAPGHWNIYDANPSTGTTYTLSGIYGNYVETAKTVSDRNSSGIYVGDFQNSQNVTKYIQSDGVYASDKGAARFLLTDADIEFGDYISLIGKYFINYMGKRGLVNWQTPSYSTSDGKSARVSSYLDISSIADEGGYVVAGLYAESDAELDNTYIAISSYEIKDSTGAVANTVYRAVTGVPVSRYYSEQEKGIYKEVAIPLADFDVSNSWVVSKIATNKAAVPEDKFPSNYKPSINYKRFLGLGIMKTKSGKEPADNYGISITKLQIANLGNCVAELSTYQTGNSYKMKWKNSGNNCLTGFEITNGGITYKVPLSSLTESDGYYIWAIPEDSDLFSDYTVRGFSENFVGNNRAGGVKTIYSKAATCKIFMETEDISNVSELADFAQRFNAGEYIEKKPVIRIKNNIDCGGQSLVPIGTKENPFNGMVYANGCSVSNFTIDATIYDYCGLFGYTKDAYINNLNVSSAEINTPDFITSSKYAGILVGYNDGGTIFGCSVTDSGICVGYNGRVYVYAGGVAGYNNGVISDTSFIGKEGFVIALESKNVISTNPNIAALVNPSENDGDTYLKTYADSYTGGIAGGNRGIISQCSARCVAEAESKFASSASGGIAGENAGVIQDCVANGKIYAVSRYGKIKAYAYAGGICGTNIQRVENSSCTTDVYSYNFTNGSYNAGSDAGGICGYNSGVVTESSALGSISSKFKSELSGRPLSAAGGVVGHNTGNIDDCTSDTLITSYSGYAGGICGHNQKGIISKSSYAAMGDNSIITSGEYANATKRYVGGIVGYNNFGFVNRCYAAVNITALYKSSDTVEYISNIAGLSAINSGEIKNCYFTGNLDGNVSASLAVENRGTIYNCYAIPSTVKNTPVNLCCTNNYGTVMNSYVCGDGLNADNTSNDIVLTDEQMKLPESYIGWDFNNIWYMGEVGYPDLNMEANETIPFSKGNGTVENPYRISNECELTAIHDFPDKAFMLVNDIELNNAWLPIGTETVPFAGTFDGNGYSINNITLDSMGKYTGVFGYTKDAEIKNVKLNFGTQTLEGHDSVNTVNYFGGVAAYAENTNLENISVSGDITLKDTNGVIGKAIGFLSGNAVAIRCNSSLNVENSMNRIAVKYGGISGELDGAIKNCINNGNSYIDISSSADTMPVVYYGGLCASVIGEVSNCYSKGIADILSNYTQNIYMGDVAGLLNGNASNCYSAGNAVSISYNGIVTNCDSTRNTSDKLNNAMQDKVYPWVETQEGADILSITPKQTYKGSKLLLIAEYAGNEEIYYTVNGTEQKYNGEFEVNDGDVITFRAKISGEYYELNKYTVNSDSGNQLEIDESQSGDFNHIFDGLPVTKDISITVGSKSDLTDVNFYLVIYDEYDKIKEVRVIHSDVSKGTNTLKFESVSLTDDISKIRLFAWGSNLMPYAEDKCVSKTDGI